MIQRIQSVFIFAVFLASVACFFFPFWIFNGVDYSGVHYSYQIGLLSIKLIEGNAQNINLGTIPILLLVSVSAILSIVSVFMYKNRQTQIKINNYNLFLNIILIGTIYLWIPYILNSALPGSQSIWQIGLIFPLLSLMFLVFANKFIKKDEELVRSADRLR
ncbi:MAG: DUF4293 domain-containing protein [Bacteroidetes bacterium]|nr:DUF4293 domain-containing protein [Bacteroidota bacterium]